MSEKKISICIIAHNAYGVLAGVDTGHSGGIEVQTPLMAKWLAKNGFSVSMITWDEGIDGEGEFDGVRVFKLCKRDDGVKVLRFFHPRWTSLNKALKSADADIYYYNCGDLGLGQVVNWTRRHKKLCIYSVANERDCYQDLSHLSSLRDRFMYKYGLRRVDRIITQTNKQTQLLKSEYGLDSIVIPMPCEGFSKFESTTQARLSNDPQHILWVGRFTKEKRLEWLLDIAERCPDLVFDVIGGQNTQTQYGKDLVKRASKLKNVIMHGRVLHENMGGFYSKAALMLSTSVYEGFPNVYLEAWSTGLPLVSTFDPDMVISKYSLGRVETDIEKLIAQLRFLLTPTEHEKASDAAIKYYTQHHKTSSSMLKFSDVFRSTAKISVVIE